MDLEYKPDWAEARERYRTWWEHGYFGRCALAVTAPRDHPPDRPAPLPPASPDQRWFDLDWISQQMDHALSRCFFGGEALPIWNAGYAGVSALPALLGCPTEIDMETGWWSPILNDPEGLDVGGLALDEDGELFQFTLRMLHRAAAESRGRSLPSIGAFGGSGDTLAALRGTEPLLMDCVLRPEAVYRAEMALMEMWVRFHDRCYHLLRGPDLGSTCWFPLWSPGRFYAAQNDFSYNIGPEMFRDLFLPAIRMQTEYLDHAVYHVDGVNAFRHVDALCDAPGIQAIQILPGAGKPGPLHYLDVLLKVQRAGRNLHIGIAPGELEYALTHLSARGLFIETWAASETEARQLLELAERLSVDRG